VSTGKSGLKANILFYGVLKIVFIANYGLRKKGITRKLQLPA
jgi:hypothetical protein